MSALPKETWTPERYLQFERQSEIKHEYFNGEIFAMAGASEEHNTITMNASASLHFQVRKRPCKVYVNDMRLKIRALRHYTYPDIMIVCGTPEVEDNYGDNLLNPTVIIEVLSPSTEKYDRETKFDYYATIPSLQEYILISQSSIRVEQYIRAEDEWRYKNATTLEGVLQLPSIECQLALADVYEKVTFEAEIGSN